MDNLHNLKDLKTEDIILYSSALQIKPKNEYFLYSSGNKGPGYVMIKGLVSRPKIMKELCKRLATKIKNFLDENNYKIDIVNGNVTGGMIPAWEVCNNLSLLYNKNIPYFYLRKSRKIGGHCELITGPSLIENKNLKNTIVIEELVCYAQTTCNASTILRESGYDVKYAGTILSYNHNQAINNLENNNINLISLVNLEDLLLRAKYLINNDPNFVPKYNSDDIDRYLNFIYNN